MSPESSHRADRDQTVLLAAAAVLAVASALFGGTSVENPLRLALVELSSLPVLVLGLRRLISGDAWRAFSRPLAVLAMIIAVVLVQQIPLPPSIWTRLPGHADEVRALALVGLPLSWRPIDLAPQEGLISALALLPPAAMLIGGLCLNGRDLRRLVWVWVAMGVLGIALGAFQLVGSEGSWAYPYTTTNYGSLVGFFANRNHEASFLLVLLPFAAALGVARRGETGLQRLAPFLTILFTLLACIGLAAVRSRAGIALAAPALIGSAIIVWRSPNAHRQARTLVAVGALIASVLVVVGFATFEPILERFDRNAHNELRLEAWPSIEKAADTYLPLGSGIGSFDTVFRSVEPLTLVSPFYFNHAHNDYLEIWLETGWLGIAALGGFVLWFAPAVWRAWSRPGPEHDLASAASVAICLLLAHSFVDYPLRMTALSTLLAYGCATLARHERSSDSGPTGNAPDRG